MSENDLHMPLEVQTPSRETEDLQEAGTSGVQGTEPAVVLGYSDDSDDPEIEFRTVIRPQPAVRPKELPRPRGSDNPGVKAELGAKRVDGDPTSSMRSGDGRDRYILPRYPSHEYPESGHRGRAEAGPAPPVRVGDGQGGHPLSRYPPHVGRDEGHGERGASVPPPPMRSGDRMGGFPLSMPPPQLCRDEGAMAAPRRGGRDGDGQSGNPLPMDPPPYVHHEERVAHASEHEGRHGDGYSGNPLPTYPTPRVANNRHPVQLTGMRVQFRPEPYDGTSDWPEYLVYFEQLS